MYNITNISSYACALFIETEIVKPNYKVEHIIFGLEENEGVVFRVQNSWW
jgi:hypothetical protein